jgi:putative ABC transport system permease protein
MLRTAFKFIKFDKSKSIGVVIAIVISIFLIGQQLGIFNFLTGLMGGVIDNSNQELGQIWVVDNITQNANELGKLDNRLVQEIRSIEGVDNTYPVIATGGTVKFKNGKTAPVLLVGSEAPMFVGGPNNARINKGNLQDLNYEGAVSAEYFDESVFNNPVEIGNRIEINGKEAFIKLQTKNARGFAGAFFFTTLSKARYYGGFPDNKVNAIAVKVKNGFTKEAVISNINNKVYGAKAWDANALKSSTIKFITISSNIGTSLGTIIIFAIISGFFIIGLTLYSSALDRIKDYGTLKAIGATNSYVTKLIILQSFLFAIVGFIIAALLLFGFKTGVANVGLTIVYSTKEIIGLFLVTVFISVGGSLFAVRRINNVEPASVFRG